MGDFNAKIGEPKKEESLITGKFGYGFRNKRGERLLHYAYEHKLTIINTLFKKNKKKKWTWLSPDKKTKNEIDFILSHSPRSFINFETISTGFPTPHKMLRGTVKLKTVKLSRKNFTNPRNQLKTIEDRSAYITNLKNAEHGLSEKGNEILDVNTYYKEIEITIKTCLNKQKDLRQKPKILTEYTLNLMKERSQLLHKQQLSQDEKARLTYLFKTTNKEIKKNYKDHRESTFTRHLKSSGSLKKAIKELNTAKQWIPSLNANAPKQQTRADVINSATEFYRRLYSASKDSYHENIETLTALNQNIETPYFNEIDILSKLEKLKDDKSPGTDGISNEAIKLAKTVILNPLTLLFNKILDEETVPKTWTESEIVLLYKKGDPTDVGNYRPISIMPCLYKLFANCLLERINNDIEKHQPREQAGFRKSFSTTDHIQVLEQVIEKYYEFRRPLYLAFIDYKKAFDSISHQSIWKALYDQNVNNKYIRIIKHIYEHSTSKIKLESSGQKIEINRGVRQGDPLSPKLFISVLQNTMKNLPWDKKGLKIGRERLHHLCFADDIVLFSESPAELQSMISELDNASTSIGLEMNISKTKVMSNRHKSPIVVNNNTIDYVDDYIYLGKQVSFRKNNNIEEIDRRISITWKKFWAYKEVMKSNMDLKLKKKVMDSCLLPCLTYGCQTWIFDSSANRKLTSCQRALERSSLNLKLRDRVRHREIRKQTGVIDALSFARGLKWRWAGHVARYTDNRWTKTVTVWSGPHGHRGRGRPKARWKDEIESIGTSNWSNLAKNRDEWQSLEEAFTRSGVQTACISD